VNEAIDLRVELAGRGYPIRIGRALLADPAVGRALGARPRVMVADATVDRLHGPPVRSALAIAPADVLTVGPGESAKSLETVGRIWDWLAARRFPRDGVVVAFGGGVVGDLAGFVAATWMRGVDFVQVPTTLLAMVDSSVGGKTAINLAAGKNLVGAFHQPIAVLADLALLDTLPPREYAAGLAETLKYGAIVDRAFFDWLEAHAADLLAREPAALAEAVRASCAHKAAIVARDERESGDRALLNFGHTFGHAIEAATGFSAVNHGEAVAIGMVLAARLSARLGRAPAEDAHRLERLLARLGLPISLPDGLDPTALLAHMRLDKKVAAGRLRLVLWRGIGRAEVVGDVPDAAILGVLSG
jgi:3-dehydroquinate synthase